MFAVNIPAEMQQYAQGPGAKFLVHDWGIWSTLVYGCRIGPPAYVA